MMRHDNYPDDIRSYESHPQSPFYDDGGFDDACEEKMQEILFDLDFIEQAFLANEEFRRDFLLAFRDFYNAQDPDIRADELVETAMKYEVLLGSFAEDEVAGSKE